MVFLTSDVEKATASVANVEFVLSFPILYSLFDKA